MDGDVSKLFGTDNNWAYALTKQPTNTMEISFPRT